MFTWKKKFYKACVSFLKVGGEINLSFVSPRGVQYGEHGRVNFRKAMDLI